MWTSEIATSILTVKGITYLSNLAFGNSTRPMLNVMAKTVNKGAYKSAEMANKVMQFVGKDELIKYGSMEKWSETFYNVMKLSSDEVSVWNKVSQLGGIKNKISVLDINNIDTVSDIVDSLNSILKTTDGLSPSDVANTLENALNNGTIKKNSIDDVKKTIESLRALNLDSAGLTSSIQSLSSSVISQLESATNLADEAKESLKYLKSIQDIKELDSKTAKKAVEALDAVKDLVNLDDMEDAAKLVSKYGDDVLKVMTKSR